MMCRQTELCMTEGPISCQLLSYTAPVLISQILQQFYSVADAAVIGQYVGPYALAAAGTAGLLLSVIINFFIGTSTGISVLTSRLFGAGQYQKLQNSITTSVLLSVGAGILMTLIGLLGSGWFLNHLQTPGEVSALAQHYLYICFWGMIPQLLFNTGTAILRSLGNTRSPLYYLGIASILNLSLDFLFVAGWGLGISGAAWATLIAQSVSAILVTRKLFCLDRRYCFSLTEVRLHRDVFSELLSTGLPAGMQAVFMSISSLVIQTSINSFGAAAMAGMTLYARIEGFLYYPLFSFGMAVTGFIGQNLGACRRDRILQGLTLALKAAAAFSLVMSILLIICADPVLKIFTSDTAVIENGRQAIRCVFPLYFLYGINQVCIGGIRGLGNTFYPMLASLLSYCVFRVVFCTVVLPFFHDMRVIYMTYNISLVIMLALLFGPLVKLCKKISEGDAEKELFHR